MSQQSAPPLTPRASLRWSIVARMVGDLRPASILEIGCGMGAVGARLATMASYTAAEPDDSSFLVASERIGPLGGTVIHGDHNKIPEGRQYDLVCAFEVLEHIADDAAALADWLPLVRPGGHLLLSVPAEPDRFGPSDVLAGHYRRYTAEQLRHRLVEAGAVDVRVRHYTWPLGYLLDWVRDRLADRRVDPSKGGTPEERTQGSGRLYQPRTPVTGMLIRAGIAPFAMVQRLRPGRGTGLIAVATRPDTANPPSAGHTP